MALSNGVKCRKILSLILMAHALSLNSNSSIHSLPWTDRMWYLFAASTAPASHCHRSDFCLNVEEEEENKKITTHLAEYLLACAVRWCHGTEWILACQRYASSIERLEQRNVTGWREGVEEWEQWKKSVSFVVFGWAFWMYLFEEIGWLYPG